MIGETISVGMVRVWVTDSTYEDLTRLLGDLGPEALSRTVLAASVEITASGSLGDTGAERGHPLVLTKQAYDALVEAVGPVNDDHAFRLIARHLQKGRR